MRDAELVEESKEVLEERLNEKLVAIMENGKPKRVFALKCDEEISNANNCEYVIYGAEDKLIKWATEIGADYLVGVKHFVCGVGGVEGWGSACFVYGDAVRVEKK